MALVLVGRAGTAAGFSTQEAQAAAPLVRRNITTVIVAERMQARRLQLPLPRGLSPLMTPAEELRAVRRELDRLCHQRFVAGLDDHDRDRYQSLAELEVLLMSVTCEGDALAT